MPKACSTCSTALTRQSFSSISAWKLVRSATPPHHGISHIRGGIVPPSEQGRDLKVTYHRFSDAEHTWHYIRQQLDTSQEMVDKRTHMIIHLEHANEQQDFELTERLVVIACLEQQVQMLQLLVPLAPVAPAVEPDAVLDVDRLKLREVFGCG
jgi:hypothetical protein